MPPQDNQPGTPPADPNQTPNVGDDPNPAPATPDPASPPASPDVSTPESTTPPVDSPVPGSDPAPAAEAPSPDPAPAVANPADNPAPETPTPVNDVPPADPNAQVPPTNATPPADAQTPGAAVNPTGPAPVQPQPVDPANPGQPAPGPMPGGQPAVGGAPATGMVGGADSTPPASGGSSGKKVLKFAAILVGGLLILTVLGVVIMTLLGGSVPKYSTLLDGSLEGDGSANSGIAYKYPEGFDEVERTSVNVEYNDFLDEETKDKDTVFAQQIVGIQVLPTGSLSQAQKVQLLNELVKEFENQGGVESAIGSDNFINGNKVKEEINEDAGYIDFEIRGEFEQDEGDPLPGIIVMRILVGDKNLYLIGVSAIQEVWDANVDVFTQVIDSAQIDQ